MTGKIFRSCFLVGLAIMVLCTALFVAVMASRYEDQVYQEMEETAVYVKRGMEESGGDYLSGLEDLEGGQRLTWIAADGTVLYDSEADPAAMENHADREEVIQAAKQAGAHDFITRLPQGYDTPLSGNGSNLSQGQRQLLSIARAAVADPPVMILDEATSSIDTRTEAIVQHGMDALMTGRTVFVIAHRLSTVQNSDAIMVLDHGRIIERGTHDQLIAQHGTYYQLYTGALELE